VLSSKVTQNEKFNAAETVGIYIAPVTQNDFKTFVARTAFAVVLHIGINGFHRGKG
jgi:hypothetical protein